MKFLFDLFPVLLFFITFKYAGQHPEAAAAWLWGDVTPEQAPILLATAVVIPATALQILYMRLKTGRVEKMLLISLGLVVVLGGLTLLLRDETFIKWKPTLLYWAIAAGMGGAALFRRNAMRLMLAGQLQEWTLPDFVWVRLNLAWILFFAAMGGLNLFVAFHFSTDIWVDFKLFGGMGLLFLFALGQGVYLSRHLREAGKDAAHGDAIPMDATSGEEKI
ncbi:MAG: septation protein A [Zoogloeaceae bacterium]|jgi:intracellular septation protein|nr:septation protein A [Zoogloeaceae bacterium]